MVSAPAIFQRIMKGLVQGIPKVAIYLHDILITGMDMADHLENLAAVLQRLKREKFLFLQVDTEYLAHKVNSQGLQHIERKVRSIVEASF